MITALWKQHMGHFLLHPANICWIFYFLFFFIFQNQSAAGDVIQLNKKKISLISQKRGCAIIRAPTPIQARAINGQKIEAFAEFRVTFSIFWTFCPEYATFLGTLYCGNQGGHTQVKMKFSVIFLCFQFFPVFLHAKICSITLVTTIEFSTSNLNLNWNLKRIHFPDVVQIPCVFPVWKN